MINRTVAEHMAMQDIGIPVYRPLRFFNGCIHFRPGRDRYGAFINGYLEGIRMPIIIFGGNNFTIQLPKNNAYVRKALNLVLPLGHIKHSYITGNTRYVNKFCGDVYINPWEALKISMISGETLNHTVGMLSDP